MERTIEVPFINANLQQQIHSSQTSRVNEINTEIHINFSGHPTTISNVILSRTLSDQNDNCNEIFSDICTEIDDNHENSEALEPQLRGNNHEHIIYSFEASEEVIISD